MKKEFFFLLAIHMVRCGINNNSIKESEEKNTESPLMQFSYSTDDPQSTTFFPIENLTTVTEKMVSETQPTFNMEETESFEEPDGPIPCTCGVFLTGQFKKGSREQPKGVPVLTTEMDNIFSNNPIGSRQCTTKCLEMIIKHLPKSSEIICATVDRDHVFKERAYLFIKNYSDKWTGTNLSAGREFCCKNNEPYKCPKN